LLSSSTLEFSFVSQFTRHQHLLKTRTCMYKP
jgi:hypothetical protein